MKEILYCTIQSISSQEWTGAILSKLMEWLSFTPAVNLLPTQPDLILFDMNKWEDQSINAEDLVAIRWVFAIFDISEWSLMMQQFSINNLTAWGRFFSSFSVTFSRLGILGVYVTWDMWVPFQVHLQALPQLLSFLCEAGVLQGHRLGSFSELKIIPFPWFLRRCCV